MVDHQAQVDELLADYRRSRQRLADVHGALASISESASSAGGHVTATVGARGTLTGLVISDDAYARYRPAELAELIVHASASATVRALEQASELLAPALPAGTDPQALLLGTGDLSAAEIDVVAPATAADEPAADELDFEQTRWIEGA